MTYVLPLANRFLEQLYLGAINLEYSKLGRLQTGLSFPSLLQRFFLTGRSTRRSVPKEVS